MEIEFYDKRTNEIINDTDDRLFVMNNVVFGDNCRSDESQASVVCFFDYIIELPKIGWRVKEHNK